MSALAPIRVILAEEQQLLRSALRTVLSAQTGITIVAEAHCARTLDEALSATPADILLLDPRVVEHDVQAALRSAQRQPTPPRVILLATVNRRRIAADALAAGVSGYLLKSCSTEDLATAIRTVHSGGTFIDQSLGGPDLRRYLDTTAARMFEELSPREQQVFMMLVRGFTNIEVAHWLGVTVKTAETFRLRVFQKLQVTSRGELFQLAEGYGIVHLSAWTPAATSALEQRSSEPAVVGRRR